MRRAMGYRVRVGSRVAASLPWRSHRLLPASYRGMSLTMSQGRAQAAIYQSRAWFTSDAEADVEAGAEAETEAEAEANADANADADSMAQPARPKYFHMTPDIDKILAEAKIVDDLVGQEDLVEMDDNVIQDLVSSGSDWSDADEKDPMPNYYETRAIVDPLDDSDADHGIPWSDEEADFEGTGKKSEASANEVLGDEWIYDQKNHVYYNTETKETLVRKAESLKLFQQRRSERSINKLSNPVDPHDQSTALATHCTELEITNLYHPEDMAGVRQRYQWMDFDKLNKVLSDADRRFFQKSPYKNQLPFRANLPYQLKGADQQDVHIEERAKMLNKLKHKFHVAEFRRVNMTRVGRVFSLGVLVLAGNGNGWAGFGYGKGIEPAAAHNRACDALRKNLMDVPLLEGRTIYSTVKGRHGRTKVLMMPRPRGAGLKGSKFMISLCECLGIRDMSSKIIGPRNPLHVCYAAFEGLSRVQSSREMALRRGVNYYRMFEAGAEHELPPTTGELAARGKVIEGHIRSAEQLRDQRLLTREKLEKWGQHEVFEGRVLNNKRGWHAPYCKKEDLIAKEDMQPKWTVGRKIDAQLQE